MTLCTLVQALTSLEVAGNELSTLPEEIGGLLALQKLAAFGNRLARLPEGSGGLAALQELWLQGNKLTALPAAIGQLQVEFEMGERVSPSQSLMQLRYILCSQSGGVLYCVQRSRCKPQQMKTSVLRLHLSGTAGPGAPVAGGQPADGPAVRVHWADVPAQPQPVRLCFPLEPWHIWVQSVYRVAAR